MVPAAGNRDVEYSIPTPCELNTAVVEVNVTPLLIPVEANPLNWSERIAGGAVAVAVKSTAINGET